MVVGAIGFSLITSFLKLEKAAPKEQGLSQEELELLYEDAFAGLEKTKERAVDPAALERERLLIEAEVKGNPLFSTDELELNQRAGTQRLCAAINNSYYVNYFPTRGETVESLNHRLESAGFYDHWVGVGINPLLQYLLPPEARELVEETRDYRQKNFTDLSLEQQLKILKLNRHLFEALYPQLCPKAALKSQTEGYMMIAFSSTHRFYLLKDSKIVVEQQVKKSALNSQRFGFLAGTSDDEIQVSFPIPFAGSSFPGPRSAKYDKRMPWGKYYLCDKGENHFAVSYPNLEDAQRCRVGKEDYQKVYLALKRKACPPKKTRAGGYIEGHALLSGSFRRVRELLADYAYKQYLEQGNSPLGGSALKALQRRLKGDVRQEYFKRDNPNLHVAVSRDWTWGCLAFEFSALDYLLAIVPKGTPLVIYGTAKYFAEEFQGDLSISTLCTEINKTGYGLLLSTPDNSVERLNEILTQLTYKKWLTIAGHKQLTDQIKDDDLKKELRKYVRLTSKYEEQPFSKLTRTQRQNRMILARMLLEFTYPGLSPKRYDFWG